INSHFCYIDHRTDRVEAKRIKMLRQLLLLCLVAIVIDQALIVSAKSKNLKHPHHPHCPPHSHWDPCSPGCEHSCATLDKDLVCTKECGPGCACDDGYVRRNSDGTGPCVRRRHCKRPHHRKCPKRARPHGPLNVHYHVDLDANAIKAMCDETAMAVVHVSVEDIARTITKKDRKKDRKNTTKKVTKKIDFENRLIFLGLIVE
ncbi:hypothetical protein SSS_10529, partial [Sarcoptes scabiei]